MDESTSSFEIIKGDEVGILNWMLKKRMMWTSLLVIFTTVKGIAADLVF